ncbi:MULTISPECIES: helix-turn-helix transcriptional regulator [unclassified Chryseobacterium]|uniref:helix-turn-helix transcriptional regulator n=1 Tax=unclassified Chryseobacterium TaxID=2593645 RepID=UPI000F45D6DC|nr:helix-turn-helix transcriptional regulator [Chryseobacterium sp. G0240]ROI03240.1 LuxR family transcriptional regulator [Chryseobacterium sp. G0240]
MELLFKSEDLEMYYDESRDIFLGRWNNCDCSDKLISGIKEYKILFDTIVPGKIVWDLTSLSYSIPPELQNWILNFLDIPASKRGIDYKVAHILSRDIYAGLSVMNMYTEGKTSFIPHFFTHENTALQWVSSRPSVQDHESKPPQLTVEQAIGQNKGRLILDVDLEELPEYIAEFLRILNNRKFYSEGLQYFKELTPKEKLVLTLIISGKANKEIADIFSISCETVKTHRKNLIRKLRCRNIAELMRYYIFL